MSATHATVPVHPATADTTAASATRAPPRANKLADFRVAVRAEDPSRPVDSDVAAAVDALTVQRAAGAKVAVQPTSLPVDIATNHQPAFPPLVHGPFSHDRIAPAAVSHTTLPARLFRQYSLGDADPAGNLPAPPPTWWVCDILTGSRSSGTPSPLSPAVR
ncbi:hypothetical protein OHQ89_46780 [Streptomyces canus]|uniref:hypothetical protein n=1 Tax=Streptomyces canus TaxID=58343 RepID=UPI0030DF74A0